ncbi:uncharacterized protein LOC129795945 isoform X1 [Lutzomyia longipalpis]|nr:uncharacterized protein LOC129795945 isoform X1 [Lutzomyia longipalpis]
MSLEMFSAEDLMIPLASMFDYEDAPPDQRSSSTRRSTTAQTKDYKWVQIEDTAVPDFTVQWDKGLSKKQKDFYRTKYPTVDKVMEDRVHCTSCDTHLGTAPIDEVTIREHPVLKVTQCSKCYAFYTSGEFDKGEDGSELYCRWCGQGGEVYCCADCPYVFCKKCIVRNLSKDTIKAIMKDDNWVCFSCKPEITWPLRAKHWALMNFIEKQRKVILSQYVSDLDVNTLLSRDLTTCCQKATPAPASAKKSTTPKVTPAKAPATVGKATSVIQKTPPVQKVATRTRKRGDPDYTAAPPSKRPMTEIPSGVVPNERSQDEVVCTPDILSMFESNTAEQTPPPLTQIPRQYGASAAANGTPVTATASSSRGAAQKKTQTITIANQSPATPIYHTINGYRIDLNSAARQETIRLPNGKLIQVKKQSTPQTQTQQSSPQMPPLIPPAIRGMRPQIPIRSQQLPVVRGVNQAQPRRQAQARQQQIRPQMNPAAQQQRPLILNGMMQPQFNVPPLIISQQAANTPYGKAKMELDNRIRNGQEICMHIIGKMNTLVASNAYKTMKSQKDVKEIHIHLSYLLTYAINRFKTLQEKSMENMKTLGFGGDVASIMSGKITASTPEEGDGDDDDIEIVEPQTTLIDLASDEEDTVKETPEEITKAKESQVFLDKLKMQPKILLKKLPGKENATKTSSDEEENEKIVRDILNEILDKVLDAVAPEPPIANGEEVGSDAADKMDTSDKAGKDGVESMDVDGAADTISIDDDDSDDVEVVEKVQNDEEAKEDTEEAPKESSNDHSNDPDVAMQDKEEGNSAKEDIEAEKLPEEDAEMTEIDSGSPGSSENKENAKEGGEEMAIDDKEEENSREIDAKEAPDDENKKTENGDLKESCEDSIKSNEEAKKEEMPEKRDEEKKAAKEDEDDSDRLTTDGYQTPPPGSETEEVASKASQEDTATKPNEEDAKDVPESPASPDSTNVTAPPPVEDAPKGFEDIDSPDEFDDALDTPATEDDLLNDLDSLGKFLDN